MSIELHCRVGRAVRLSLTPIGATQITIEEPANPAILIDAQQGNKLLGCVAPYVISCAGAIDRSGEISIDGKVDLLLNGQTVASNLSAMELIEHFKDHPTLEVTPVLSNLAGATWIQSFGRGGPLNDWADSGFDKAFHGTNQLWLLESNDQPMNVTLSIHSTKDLNKIHQFDLIDLDQLPTIVPFPTQVNEKILYRTYTLFDDFVINVYYGFFTGPQNEGSRGWEIETVAPFDAPALIYLYAQFNGEYASVTPRVNTLPPQGELPESKAIAVEIGTFQGVNNT